MLFTMKFDILGHVFYNTDSTGRRINRESKVRRRMRSGAMERDEKDRNLVRNMSRVSIDVFNPFGLQKSVK